METFFLEGAVEREARRAGFLGTRLRLAFRGNPERTLFFFKKTIIFFGVQSLFSHLITLLNKSKVIAFAAFL